MAKHTLFKYLASKPKIVVQMLTATNIKHAVFDTCYGDVCVPVNSKSIIQAFLDNRYFGEQEIRNFLNLKTASKTILNIGANVGTTAKMLQASGKYETIKCFEPDPENFRALRVNCGEFSSIEIYNTAIGSKNETLRLNLSKKIVGKHSFKVNFSQGSIEVPVATLDKYLSPDETFDIYLDVEGWEIEVLKGAESILKNCQICALEWNEHLHDPSEKSDMFDIVRQAGFTGFFDLSDTTKKYAVSRFSAMKGQRDIVLVRDDYDGLNFSST